MVSDYTFGEPVPRGLSSLRELVFGEQEVRHALSSCP